jgi:hypothetical protein
MKLELDESNGKIENDNSSTLNLDDSNIVISNKIPTDEQFDNIDLRIEKDELVVKNDFSIQKNDYKKIKMRRYGNTYTFLFDKNGDPKIVIGPHCKKINIFSFYVFFLLIKFFYFLKIKGLFFYASQLQYLQ